MFRYNIKLSLRGWRSKLVHFQKELVHRFLLLGASTGLQWVFFVTLDLFGTGLPLLADLQLLQKVDLALAKVRTFVILGRASSWKEVEWKFVLVKVGAPLQLNDDGHVIEEPVSLRSFLSLNLDFVLSLVDDAAWYPSRTFRWWPPEDFKFLFKGENVSRLVARWEFFVFLDPGLTPPRCLRFSLISCRLLRKILRWS